MSFWLGACRGEKLACDLPLFPSSHDSSTLGRQQAGGGGFRPLVGSYRVARLETFSNRDSPKQGRAWRFVQRDVRKSRRLFRKSPYVGIACWEKDGEICKNN